MQGKKQIGIMTFWDCPNFGSFLQAYALRAELEDLFPEADVRQIAYSNKRHMDVYYGFFRKSLFRCYIVRLGFYLDAISRLRNRKRIKALRKFRINYSRFIKHTEILNKHQLKKQKFDTLVMGSDIIWDYSVPFFDADEVLFGEGIDADNKVAYAASFGTVSRKNDHPRYVVDAITNMDSISVRDENSSDIVNDISGKKSQVVLDPTLLWDFKNDNNIKSPEVDYKYVAVYGSYFTDNQINGLKDYCEHNNYKILCLDTGMDTCEWCDVFIDASTITPFEWCGYISNAELLMTSTFHGFLFGLIFEKRIIFNATDFMKAKLTDFTKDLCLYESIILDDKFENQIKLTWDYRVINSIIDERREESIEFLRSKVINK